MSLSTEPGSFYLDNPNARYTTFSYKGDPDFIARTENMLINQGVVAKTHLINECFGYALLEIKELKRALFNQFRAEIIQERTPLIDYLVKEIKDANEDIIGVDIEWDEGKLIELSNKKVEDFMQQITLNGEAVYMTNKITGADEYNLGSYQDLEQL